VPIKRSLRPRGWAAAGLTVTAALTVVACSGAPSLVGPAAASSSAAGHSATSAPDGGGRTSKDSSSRPLAPLTGLPAASKGAASRPAVVLALAGPDPHGLTSADMVFEEIATPIRYVAVYQSRQARSAGPVTATQPPDAQTLAVLHPLFGYNGAKAPFFVGTLDKSKVTDLGYTNHPSLYSTTPLGLTTSTRAIWGAAHGGTAPPPVFQYAGDGSGAQKLAAADSRPSSVRLAFPGGGTQEWAFDRHASMWSLTGGGPKVQVANLVVQTVPYRQVGVNRRFGVTLPSAQVLGTGKAEVLSGDTMVSGSWSKPHPGDVTNYFDARGYPIPLHPGPTWVVLAPTSTRVSTSGAQ
jgi:Protein of unknown function (DUF3048) C-terminal domain/Protein of unknown function (DUF3048) N-terminal domain